MEPFLDLARPVFPDVFGFGKRDEAGFFDCKPTLKTAQDGEGFRLESLVIELIVVTMDDQVNAFVLRRA
jgi:hypothetical protein